MNSRGAQPYACVAVSAVCMVPTRVSLSATRVAPSRGSELQLRHFGQKNAGLQPLGTLLTCVKPLLAIIALALMSQCVLAQENSTTDANRAWVQKIFPLALDQLFPVEHAEGDFIAVRTHQEGLNEVPEYSFILEDTQDAHSLRATVREAQGSSLFDQLLALHAKDPSKSFADLMPSIKVQESRLSVAQCPALTTQLAAYQNITFVRPHDDDPVGEHPILYEFHESVGGSDSEAIEFVESRAFPQWANATRKALAACLAFRPGASAP